MRDHDHTVECIAWSPEASAPAINEAAGADNKKGAHQGPFLASGSRDKTICVSSIITPVTHTLESDINMFMLLGLGRQRRRLPIHAKRSRQLGPWYRVPSGWQIHHFGQRR